ncbi:prolipoprotein diacylglyceryl transferase [Elusimicrobiota bacterium]
MFPKLLSIGNLTIHTYGLFVAIGAVLGFNLVLKHAKYRNLSNDFMNNLFLGMIFSGFIGARIMYVMYEFDQYRTDLIKTLMFWEGGLVFLGGLLGGGFWVLIWCKKTGVSFWDVADVLSVGLAFAHAMGRIGCFFAGCCYGRPADMFFCITFNKPSSLAFPLGTPLHPTQIYSAGFLLLLSFILSNKLKKKTAGSASVFGLYLAAYGLFRFFIEFFRGDYRGVQIAGVTVTQISAMLFFVLGLYLLGVSKVHPQND